MDRGILLRRCFLPLWGVFFAVPGFLLPYAAWHVLENFSGTAGEYDTFECALVFGAAVHSVSDPGPAILRRVQTGVRLFQDGRIDRMILTGGQGSQFQRSEAAVMSSVAQSAGVPAEKIILEDQSSSTEENLRNVKPLLADCDSIVGISDPYHLARIGLLASHEGIHLSLLPTDTTIKPSFLMQSIIRETLGYAYYVVAPR